MGKLNKKAFSTQPLFKERAQAGIILDQENAIEVRQGLGHLILC